MCVYIVYHRQDLYLFLIVLFFKKKTNTVLIPPLPSPPLSYPSLDRVHTTSTSVR